MVCVYIYINNYINNNNEYNNIIKHVRLMLVGFGKHAYFFSWA